MDHKLVWAVVAVGVAAAAVGSLRVSTAIDAPLEVAHRAPAPPPRVVAAPPLRPALADAPGDLAPGDLAPADIGPGGLRAPPEPEVGQSGEEILVARLASLDRALAVDGGDPAWSADAEALTRSHLSGRADLEPIEVACGSTFCRLTFAVVDPMLEPSAAAHVAMPWQAPALVSMNLDGDRIATVFLAREGYTLPEG